MHNLAAQGQCNARFESDVVCHSLGAYMPHATHRAAMALLSKKLDYQRLFRFHLSLSFCSCHKFNVKGSALVGDPVEMIDDDRTPVVVGAARSPILKESH